MGMGDWILGTGQVKGHFARTGRRVAFGAGPGHKPHLSDLFWGNPNIATKLQWKQGEPLDWITTNYKGRRPYHNHAACTETHWAYSDFRATPGEIFLTPEEQRLADVYRPARLVLIEPNTDANQPNKQWPKGWYELVAGGLKVEGYTVAQMGPAGTPWIKSALRIETPTFRDACAVMSVARLYIGPEGGLHHAAAAFGVPAVVIFGGFNHPRNTGYDFHRNLFRGGYRPCGARIPCSHCHDALQAISTDEVYRHAKELLR